MRDRNETESGGCLEHYFNRKEMILKVYLYNFYRGKLLEYEGELLVRSKYQAIFRVLNKNGNIIRVLKCDPKPGVLYNRNVWFDEANKVRAIDIFMDNELSKINKLDEELQKRKITVNELMRMKAEVLIRDAVKSEKTETDQE